MSQASEPAVPRIPTTNGTQRYWLERALIGDSVHEGVAVTIEDGRFTDVWQSEAAGGATTVAGLTVPGFANCHSHAFHRGLRGRVQTGSGTFWTWREQMYDLAGRLTPDSYLRLARAVFAEMVASGFTAVGEFHYLHHDPDGQPYADPNAMGEALITAARDAGLRICLLDTCYLAAGIDDAGRAQPVEGPQQRFTDRDAGRWAHRVDDLAARTASDPDVRLGAAVHSVRAVPADQLPTIATWAQDRGAPLHVHLSEQPAENAQALAAYGLTPTGLLDRTGVLGPRTSVVHATHLTGDDLRVLGGHGCFGCICPTTEQDLGDGIGPTVALRETGTMITIGTDSHAVIDPFVELRQLEMGERLAQQSRGHWSAGDLLRAGMAAGHASLGFDDAGHIAVGARADLVTLDARSARTAGTGDSAETVAFAATAADVRQVIIDGTVRFVSEERDSVGRELQQAIEHAWEEHRP